MTRLTELIRTLERHRFIRALLFAGSLALFVSGISGLLLGLMGAYVPRLDMFMQFTLQLGLMSVAGLFALMVRPWRLITLGTGTAIAFVLPAVLSYWSFNLPREAAIPQASFKVLSFNIWAANKDFDQMIELFDHHQADVLILHEFAKWHAPLLPRLAKRYPYRHTCENNWHCHTVLFSKHPWDNAGRQTRDKFYPEMAWVQFGADLGGVTVYGVHMARPLESTVKQRRELKKLASVLNATKTPFIVGGDFNATPWSITVRRLKKWGGLNAFPTILPSWPIQQHRVAWFPPQLAIDHLFFSPGVQANRVYLGKPSGSDHLPIVGEFALPQPNRIAVKSTD